MRYQRGDLDIYASPNTVICPKCGASPENPCIDQRDGVSVREYWHTTRERVPYRYKCRICFGPFTVSSATGLWVHSQPSDTHNAEPFDDLRGWKPYA